MSHSSHSFSAFRPLLRFAGLAAVGLVSVLGGAGCDDGPSDTTGGTGGATTSMGTGGATTGMGGTGGATTGMGGSGGATTGMGGTGGATTGMGGTGGAGGATGGTGGNNVAPCDPQCAAVDGVPSECVAITDNGGLPTYGLRIAQITFTKPTALTAPIVKAVLESSITMDLPDCNLTGDGGLSWLLQIDSNAQKLTTGGAKPVADPTAGYCFVNETLAGLPVAPLESNAAPDANGTLTMAMGGSVNIPLFLGGGQDVLLFPLRKMRIVGAQLSPDQNCIGVYNSSLLLPQDLCEPSGAVKRFTEAGDLDAHITLEDADAVIISSLAQSLCVLLTGDSGNGQSPKKCARDGNGQIIAKGDWCSVTDAMGGCQDSMKLTGTFAASAVKINGNCP